MHSQAGFRRLCRAPRDGAQAGEQNAKGEGFGEVIVRAGASSPRTTSAAASRAVQSIKTGVFRRSAARHAAHQVDTRPCPGIITSRRMAGRSRSASAALESSTPSAAKVTVRIFFLPGPGGRAFAHRVLSSTTKIHTALPPHPSPATSGVVKIREAAAHALCLPESIVEGG